jgi:16S rRNA (cytosine967-C5)-methyltransferase
VAARVLHAVVERGQFLETALAEQLPTLAAGKPAALVSELCYGTLRKYFSLTAIARAYLERPLKPADADIRLLLLLGLYQLRALRAPAAVSVSETVEAATQLGKPWAKGLLNACLRAWLREPQRGEARLARDAGAGLDHPSWLLERLGTAWPEHWRAIIAANNRRPPFILRVNARRVSRDDYLSRLRAAGIEARAAACTTSGVVLARPMDAAALPGFAEGLVSVQDAAAQLAAEWLDAQAGERILDACAAPGGKTTHILERTPALGELVAVEIDADRTRRLLENLARLGLAARVLTADAARPASWWDGRPFDRILCDAPCSASGVIRRHPDIKLRRAPEDLPRLAASQAALLAALWPLLKPGGKLLYVTCSILPDENEFTLAAFLSRHADAAPLPLPDGIGVARGGGRQILPGEACGAGDDAGMDGFYYALLAKR